MQFEMFQIGHCNKPDLENNTLYTDSVLGAGLTVYYMMAEMSNGRDFTVYTVLDQYH